MVEPTDVGLDPIFSGDCCSVEGCKLLVAETRRRHGDRCGVRRASDKRLGQSCRRCAGKVRAAWTRLSLWDEVVAAQKRGAALRFHLIPQYAKLAKYSHVRDILSVISEIVQLLSLKPLSPPPR